MAKKRENSELSCSELIVKRNELRKKYMDFRFQMVVGHVQNRLQKRVYRREIAALNTYIRQHEIAELKKLVADAK
jgi:large subunit ribosomal protein L29